jgi:hypothetical protein
LLLFDQAKRRKRKDNKFIRWVEDGIEWFRFDFCQQPMANSQQLFFVR